MPTPELCSLVSDFTTGSSPPFANGLHRNTRTIAIRLPRATPYRSTASIAYSEQDGTYRHAGRNIGETAHLYARSKNRTIVLGRFIRFPCPCEEPRSLALL